MAVNLNDPFTFWLDMASMWLGTFFYGIYLVLCCICIHILLHRPRPYSASTTIFFATAITLFVLSTLQAAINLFLGSGDILGLDLPYDRWEFADDMIYVANNLVADSLLIYRCWLIWNRNWLVIAPGIVGLIVTNIFGFNPNTPPPPFFALTLGTNVFITFLTAGRIWWIYRTVHHHLKEGGSSKHYSSSIAIVLESGLIYSVFVAARLAVQEQERILVVTEILRQVVGIVPTLIIVRVGLGVSVESSSGSKGDPSSLHFHARSSPDSLGSERSFIGGYEEQRQSDWTRWRREPIFPPAGRSVAVTLVSPPRRKQSLPDVEKDPGGVDLELRFAANTNEFKGSVRAVRPLPKAPEYSARW
ncbi:hypothetical protein MIND_01326400 [Mycena indigotica]|uniref:Uncharacterized protein n=1 Tax=Mycena indigotica TaxID=2126181 RepID=A0A8H6VR06_9AGAR|nr:uncharacterized protein MIND_01326400 [Mycena indigotica]KAF7290852.1 hypothetical protein MIND_01326400 [Mycena indigotica]